MQTFICSFECSKLFPQTSSYNIRILWIRRQKPRRLSFQCQWINIRLNSDISTINFMLELSWVELSWQTQNYQLLSDHKRQSRKFSAYWRGFWPLKTIKLCNIINIIVSHHSDNNKNDHLLHYIEHLLTILLFVVECRVFLLGVVPFFTFQKECKINEMITACVLWMIFTLLKLQHVKPQASRHDMTKQMYVLVFLQFSFIMR